MMAQPKDLPMGLRMDLPIPMMDLLTVSLMGTQKGLGMV
jgi:hypothetical protein